MPSKWFRSFLIVLACFGASLEAAPRGGRAEATVTRMLTSMGGEGRLGQLETLQWQAKEVAYRIDDSERREEPSWIWVRDVTEVRDLRRGRQLKRIQHFSPQFTFDTRIIDDGKATATELTWKGQTTWTARPADRAWLDLSPERLGFTARSAPDLRSKGVVAIDGAPHEKLSFTWKGFPVDIYVDHALFLPRRVEILQTDPLDQAQSAWGDVRWRTDFLFWKREAGGFFYPRQWNVYRNGRPYSVASLTAVEVGKAVENGDFILPAQAVAALKSGSVPFGERSAVDAASGFLPIGQDVWLVKGPWNLVVVRQPDGLVVVEAPHSTGYSSRVLAALALKFPGVPLKAVVSTTDTLFHVAGIRTYVARGLPIYALDLTVPLLRELVAAPHTLRPDELASSPREPVFHPVSDRTTIGSGSTALQIIPIRGHADERMLMVYLPAQRLLYGSSNDVVQREGKLTGTFNLPEIILAVERERLHVETYVAIHTDRMTWQEVVKVAHSS